MTGQDNSGGSMARVRRSRDEARAAYDRMSGWYDLLAGSSEQKCVRAGLRQLDAQSGERILEIGFGTGDGLVSLARSVGSSGGVYGVDVSPGMANVAARKLSREGERDEVGLICGDGAHLSLSEQSMDGVFMSFTLELFDTPRIPLVLGECRRVLREGGRLAVVSLARRDPLPVTVRFYEWVHHRFPRWVDCRPIPVTSVLDKAGFQIVELEQRTMWSLPVDIVTAAKRSS